jgi:hypothetical protein
MPKKPPNLLFKIGRYDVFRDPYYPAAAAVDYAQNKGQGDGGRAPGAFFIRKMRGFDIEMMFFLYINGGFS